MYFSDSITLRTVAVWQRAYVLTTNCADGDTITIGTVVLTCGVDFFRSNDPSITNTGIVDAINANTTLRALYTAAVADNVPTGEVFSLGGAGTPPAIQTTGTCVIVNGAITAAKDADGYSAPTNIDTVVWANEKSVTRSEFYAANANQINAVTAFEIHVEDWNDQTQVIAGTKTYYIVRAYQKGEGIVELTCSDKAV